MNKKILSLLFILLAIATIPVFASTNNYAIVAATNVRIRNIPSTKGAIMATLKLGVWAKITAISKEQDYLIGKNDFFLPNPYLIYDVGKICLL